MSREMKMREDARRMAMFGTCVKYNRLESYGFIAPDDPSLPDFFACPAFITSEKNHRRFLVPGYRVEFTPFDVEGRPQAHSIKVIARTVALQRSAAPEVQ